VSKLHSCVCKSHFTYEITLLGWKSHSACQNHTLRVKVTLVRVEIILVHVVITFVPYCVWKHTLRTEITLFVWKLHSAWTNHTCECWNHTFRSETTLCVILWSSHYACKHTRVWWVCVLKIKCRSKNIFKNLHAKITPLIIFGSDDSSKYCTPSYTTPSNFHSFTPAFFVITPISRPPSWIRAWFFFRK
jgi:hypothetical protein